MLNVAVIGVGNMGRYHARNYFEIPNAKLVAIADLDEGRGKEIAQRYRCRFYRDYVEMLADEKLDAVSVAVPTHFHEKVALDVINAGLHVLVEKPLSQDVASAKRIIRAAWKAGVRLAVGHVERFNPVVGKLKELIDQEELGDILDISIKRVGLPWPKITDTNVVNDLAIHDLDLLYYLLGKEPDRIWAHGGRSAEQNQEDYAKILLTFGPVGCVVEVNWITPVKIRKMGVTGSLAYVEADLIAQELILYRGIQSISSEENFEEFRKKWEPRGEAIKIEKKEPLRLELESFLNCILHDTESVVTGSDGLRALELAQRVTRIIRRKK